MQLRAKKDKNLPFYSVRLHLPLYFTPSLIIFLHTFYGAAKPKRYQVMEKSEINCVAELQVEGSAITGATPSYNVLKDNDCLLAHLRKSKRWSPNV